MIDRNEPQLSAEDKDRGFSLVQRHLESLLDQLPMEGESKDVNSVIDAVTNTYVNEIVNARDKLKE